MTSEMATVADYERPSTIEDALALLHWPGAVPLGGGTKLNTDATDTPLVLVDLQALRLDGIEPSGGDTLAVGAGVTLQTLADHPAVPPAVRDAARRELPSTLRAMATVGGCLATAEADSELYAALLVHDAVIRTATGRMLPLGDGSPVPGDDFVVSVEIDCGGVCACARTGRTHADRAIVAALARRAADGSQRLALTGVATRPVLVDDIEELEPPSDFRGSAEYRRELASILAQRVLEELA